MSRDIYDKTTNTRACFSVIIRVLTEAHDKLSLLLKNIYIHKFCLIKEKLILPCNNDISYTINYIDFCINEFDDVLWLKPNRCLA